MTEMMQTISTEYMSVVGAVLLLVFSLYRGLYKDFKWLLVYPIISFIWLNFEKLPEILIDLYHKNFNDSLMNTNIAFLVLLMIYFVFDSLLFAVLYIKEKGG